MVSRYRVALQFLSLLMFQLGTAADAAAQVYSVTANLAEEVSPPMYHNEYPMPTPTPTPAPPPQECPIYKVSVDATGDGGNNLKLSGPGSTLACLNRIVQACQENKNVDSDHKDDCVADTLCREDKIINGREQCNNSDLTLYVDRDCAAVKTPESFTDSQCYFKITYIKTPVSLVFAQAKKEAPSLVDFPIAPENPGVKYLWKASAEWPLVVYDPSHKGEITSAQQLFGNDTFGKKWNHGYDALASLDSDKDGKLAKDELGDLGLWFDRNRNGISESGEVQSAALAQVSAIYVKADSRDPLTNELLAAKGFDRSIDGITVSGPSIDWQATAETAPQAENKAAEDPVLARQRLAQTAPVQKDLSGTWVWSVEDDLNKHKPQGVLVFRDGSKGLNGTSYVEIPMKNPGSDAAGLIRSFAVNGEKSQLEDGTIVIRFDSEDGNNNVTQNEARLSYDGQILYGKSTSTYLVGGTTGRSENFSYTWKAYRN